MENKIRKGIWLVVFMLFVGSVFVGDVCFAEDQNIFLRSDVNSDLQTDYFDFSEFAKYWQWIDLRDESHFEIYQDYIDFWDPNTGDSSSFDVSGKQFDFDEDGVVGSIDLMFMCDEWLMTGYSYPRGVLTSKVSDVDLDGVVGPMDLAYFSEYWLWFDVRDPNNFQTPQDYEDFWDPNTLDPNTIDFTGMYFDFTEDGHVNLADLGILAQDWLGVAEHLPSNISVEFSGDINYLDGVVDYELQGFKNTTKEIYVLLDSKIIDIITLSEINVSDGILSHLLGTEGFRNGAHQLAFMGVDRWGFVEISDLFDIGFNNLLSNSTTSEYYTSQGYFLSGSYSGSKSLKVKVTKNSSVVYSQTIPAGDVNVHIPPEVFGGSRVLSYEISLSELSDPNTVDPNSMDSSSALMQLIAFAESAPSFKEWKKDVYKKFDKSAYDPNDTQKRVLFLLPDKKVTDLRWDVVSSEMQACDDRDVEHIDLYHKDVNHENLDYVFGTLRNINVVFFHGHANSHVTGADGVEFQRTHLQCWRKKVIPWLPDYYVESRMFSGRNSTLLPDDWEEDGFFLWPYNLGMRYVLADGCLTGLYFDLGMAFCRSPFMGQINRAFLGWKKKVFIGAGYLAAITKSDEGLIEIVETLGENKTPDDNKTLGNALANTTSLDIGVRRELWGADGMMDADFDGDDNLRILMWGTGQPAPTYRIYLDHGF